MAWCNGQKVGCFLDVMLKWTKSRLFFSIGFCGILFQCLSSIYSSKTEVGSAGEQPARDSLMTDENVNQRGSLFELL